MTSEKYSVNILIVDDRPENLLALESLLKDDVTQIFKANSGREALELLLRHEFALALLDVQMPEMNGFELAELMRLKDRTKAIPIIFVTAGAIDPKHTFKGYEAGAVDFLYKPLDYRVVRSKVRVFRELEQQSQMIRNQMEQVSAALKAREEFMSIASHELKTPITSMQLQLQMLLRSITSNPTNPVPAERVSKALNTSVKQLKKLVQIIDELLDVSRIQAGKFFVDLEKVNLSELVTSTAANFEEQLALAQCKLTLAVQPDLTVTCDAFRTEQVLTNLITNVMKYAPNNPVTISLNSKGSSVELVVQDSGAGIPTEKLSIIFDRYERIDNEKAVSGLGLGLYIVREIMEAQGGTIHVESLPNQGSKFTATFPA
jgi:signal transduction histidine kinase